jgi:phosphoribosylaminoimidazole-succinocarboxamide synthase
MAAHSSDIQEVVKAFLGTALESTNFKDLGRRYVGKVRDVYSQDDRSILIATDRQSAFDISWCTIPLKGQVLNQISAWWFKQIEDVMPHHVLAVPDENVMVVKKLEMLPVEIVVRGYLAGSTTTSAWVNYSKGVRLFCGNHLPDGLVKNQILPGGPIITPTTKGEHDEPIAPDELVRRGLMSQELWREVSVKALELFRRGQEIARQRGLILVDTKYEMGLDPHGVLTLADEVHTPDSSRYWIASTYDSRMSEGREPESLDKEFFRMWLREQGFQDGGNRPLITDHVRVMLAEKYIDLLERMTGEQFVPPVNSDVIGRIRRNLQPYEISASQ